jgi:3-oxoacyl-[acyl-carrier protein] reductase
VIGKLRGKYALVTGASRGIGKMIALRLAEEGAHVFVHFGRSVQEARVVLEHINSLGGRASIVGADFKDIGTISALIGAVAEVIAKEGGTGLDILVNNAAIGTAGSIYETDQIHFDDLFDINLKAMFFLTKAMLGQMNDGGRIINISSIVSLTAYPECIAYSMTKAGVNAFTRSLAQELGPRGITVNAVAPGITATDLVGALLEDKEVAQNFVSKIALGRIGKPSDVATVIAFLASSDAGWITGQALPVCGGSDL